MTTSKRIEQIQKKLNKRLKERKVSKKKRTSMERLMLNVKTKRPKFQYKITKVIKPINKNFRPKKFYNRRKAL